MFRRDQLDKECFTSPVFTRSFQVLAYASKQLKDAELKYATVEKEAYAVVFAIKQFRHYLSGRQFTVISDHRPLQWLTQQKDNNGRLGRWAILLGGYDYKIVYRPGKIHQNADCMSRLRIAAVSASTGADDRLIKEKQASDALCKSIINYLNNGTFEKTDNGTPSWVKEIEFYNIINGILYRCAPSTKEKRRHEETIQLVLPLSLRKKVLIQMHDDPTSGHLAFMRTYLKVSKNYYWPNMRQDIKSYCDCCATCVANSRSSKKAPLHPLEQATAPFQVIGIDFLGPITPRSPSGNAYVMVITCYFSKWAEAIALPNQTALTTVEALHKSIIQRHGPPKVIITDRGTNFTSDLFETYCKKFSIKHRLTTAYHPASNGETERFNRTLISMLRKLLEDGQHINWEDLLGDVCFAYRSSVHSSTLESPYFLVHGRDPNIAINNLLEAPPIVNPTPSDYVGNLMKNLEIGFQRAIIENEKARQKQKTQYDKKASEHRFQIGDRVLMDTKVVNKGDSRKFTSLYRGPYRVIRVYENYTVDICDASFKKQRVHVNRLKHLPDAMLFGDENCPPFKPTVENFNFHLEKETQTNDSPLQRTATPCENPYQHFSLSLPPIREPIEPAGDPQFANPLPGHPNELIQDVVLDDIHVDVNNPQADDRDIPHDINPPFNNPQANVRDVSHGEQRQSATPFSHAPAQQNLQVENTRSLRPRATLRAPQKLGDWTQ